MCRLKLEKNNALICIKYNIRILHMYATKIYIYIYIYILAWPFDPPYLTNMTKITFLQALIDSSMPAELKKMQTGPKIILHGL